MYQQINLAVHLEVHRVVVHEEQKMVRLHGNCVEIYVVFE